MGTYKPLRGDDLSGVKIDVGLPDLEKLIERIPKSIDMPEFDFSSFSNKTFEVKIDNQIDLEEFKEIFRRCETVLQSIEQKPTPNAPIITLPEVKVKIDPPTVSVEAPAIHLQMKPLVTSIVKIDGIKSMIVTGLLLSSVLLMQLIILSYLLVKNVFIY